MQNFGSERGEKMDNRSYIGCRLSEDEENNFYRMLMKTNLCKSDFIKQKIFKEEQDNLVALENKIDQLTSNTHDLLVNQHVIFKLTEGILSELLKKSYDNSEELIKNFIEAVYKEAVVKMVDR